MSKTNPTFNPPSLYPLGGIWFLTEGNMDVYWNKEDVDIVPMWMITDGPSIPKCLRWLLPWTAILLPGLWHDYNRGKSDKGTFAIDAEFFELCKESLKREQKDPIKLSKWNWFRAFAAFVAVTIGRITDFTSSPNPQVIARAQKRVAEATGKSIIDLQYDPQTQTFKLIPPKN